MNNFSPLPLKNEPLLRKILPLNIEPLSTEVTTNPSLGDTDAVTEPLTINDDNNASSVRAERGMLNKFSPLPENDEPDDRNILPLKIEPLSTEVTTNPKSGDTEAVTEPLTIKDESKASSVSADLGMLNKFHRNLPIRNPLQARETALCTAHPHKGLGRKRG